MKKRENTLAKARRTESIIAFLLGLLLLLEPLDALAAINPSAQELYATGLKFLREKKYLDGATALEKASIKNPSLIAAHIELAKALTLLQRRKEALYKLNLAKKYAQSKKAKRRIQENIFLLSETFYTNESFQLYQNGLNHMKTNKLKLAIQSLEQALKKEPDNVAMLLLYGKALQKNGAQQRSIKFLEKAFSKNPDKEELRVWLARALIDTNPDRAAYCLAPLLNKEKLEEDVYILYARALALTERKEKAIQVLRKSLAKYSKGISLYWIGKYYSDLSKNDWIARRYLLLFLRQKREIPEKYMPRSYETSAKEILSELNKRLEISTPEQNI